MRQLGRSLTCDSLRPEIMAETMCQTHSQTLNAFSNYRQTTKDARLDRLFARPTSLFPGSHQQIPFILCGISEDADPGKCLEAMTSASMLLTWLFFSRLMDATQEAGI